MKTAVLALGLLLTACAGVRELPKPRSLYVEPVVLRTMLEIQTEYENETVRCLTGEITPEGEVRVLGIAPTWIHFRNRHSVLFSACTQEDVIGWYHNHPTQEPPACYASRRDMQTGDTPPLIVTIITCTPLRLVFRFPGDSTVQGVRVFQ